ncbi:MAG: hypothetical protein R3305_09630 [Gammaproteobacteria bacterium]|nr:hypothetical protein [Gammaproteobacteria bacterium]
MADEAGGDSRAQQSQDQADGAGEAPTLVERWLQDQLEWQKTAMSFLDSMVNNDEFLVHLGNAMRGSLLAGKPYPTAPDPGASVPESETDDRIDQILFALHRIEGQLTDLRMSIDDLEAERRSRKRKSKNKDKEKKSRKASARGSRKKGEKLSREEGRDA